MSRFTERPVIDVTGTEGQFDFDLTFAPETTQAIPVGDRPGPDARPSSEPATSVFDAVQRYGLGLERRKVAMDLLTITHIERLPTPN
jgi:uncharacterized protein (TIGR03435 family)